MHIPYYALLYRFLSFAHFDRFGGNGTVSIFFHSSLLFDCCCMFETRYAFDELTLLLFFTPTLTIINPINKPSSVFFLWVQLLLWKKIVRK